LTIALHVRGRVMNVKRLATGRFAILLQKKTVPYIRSQNYMNTHKDRRSDSSFVQWIELLCWGIVLGFATLATLRIMEFSTPFLTAFFFVAFGTIILVKWASGSPLLRDMRNFIYIGVLFWILLDPLQMREGIEEFTNQVIAETLLYVALFLIMVTLGYRLFPSRRLANFFERIGDPTGSRNTYFSLVFLYAIGIIPILYYSEGSLTTFLDTLLAGYNWDSAPGWRRGALGSAADYVFTVCFLTYNVTPFLAMWLMRKAPLHPLAKVFPLLVILSVPIFYFFSGSRRLFAFIVLGLMFYFYTSLPSSRRTRWRILLLLIPFVLLFAMQFQVKFRVSGFYDAEISVLDLDVTEFHRDNMFFWFLTAVDTMPNLYPFTGEIMYSDLLLHPIPRFLWPEKPISFGFPFVDFEKAGATLTVSVIGQLYVAQGPLGVILLGLLFGWAARNWDQVIRNTPDGSIRSLIYYTGGVLFFVIGIRNFGEIVTQWYTIGILVLLAYLVGRSAPTPSRKALVM